MPSFASDSIAPDARVFATTRWSVVLRAGAESTEAADALATLCRAYWYPLYGSPDCIDRNSVAILLASIADGNGYYHVHSQLESLRNSYEESLARRGTSIANEIEKEADYLKVIREMSLEVLPLLEPFLDSPDWYTREAVVGALRRYAEHIPHICARLQQRLSVEVHEDVRDRIEEALAEIGQAQQSAAPNADPTTPFGYSRATEGPPWVS